MERTQFKKNVRRAFTARYLETVWPRSYWNTGPVRHARAPRCSRPRLEPSNSPKLDKSRRRVRIAWADDRSTSESSQASEVSQTSQTSQVSQSQQSPDLPEIAIGPQELPRRNSHIYNSSEEMLRKDKKRQAVYSKMQDIGSLKLVLAQVPGSNMLASYQFADAIGTSNL